MTGDGERNVDITTYEAIVNVYRNASDEIKRWTKVRDDCNKTLKDVVGEGVGLLDGVPAIRIQRVVSRRFDAKLFVDEFPELAEKYMVIKESVRLTVIDDAASD